MLRLLHAINEYHIERTGGLRGRTLNPHKLIWIAETVNDSIVFGQDWYPTIPDKATFLVCNLIQGHCFQDANKRTGISAMLMYLWKNGYTLRTQADDLESFASLIAQRAIDSADAKAWIVKRLQEVVPYEEELDALDAYAEVWQALARM